jgi:hypothetical protein
MWRATVGLSRHETDSLSIRDQSTNKARIPLVSFSRDGRWVAYVTYPEGELWRSKLDGSQKLKLAILGRYPSQKRSEFAMTTLHATHTGVGLDRKD